MTVAFSSSIKRYSFAALSVAIALVIMLILDPWVNMSKTPFLLFFSAVMASAWYGGLKPGLFATCLSIVFSNYFFLEPIYTLNFDLPNSVRSSLFFIDGVIISGLCNLLKNAKRRAEINLHKLQKSEQRFKLALKSTDILIFHQDLELRYQWIYNHHHPERAEAMLGKFEYDLFPISEAEKLTKIKRTVIETGISAHEEVCLTVEGKSNYYDLMIEPLKINGEAIEGISCAAVNISQRKRTEEALRYSEERYRSLVESLPQLVCISPELGKLDYCNKSWINYTGLTLEQAQKLGWQQLIHPDDLPVFISEWTNATQTGKAVSLEFRLRRVDGIYRWYLGRGVPICNQDGNILAWLATATDIDDQKRQEQMQRFLAESSRAFAEASLNMQAVMDSITLRIAELFGDACLLYIPLLVEGRKLGQFGISFAQEQAFGEEDKAFMLTLAQQCAQAIARAQLYEAEQKARDEAEVANRVKDEFLAVLSHELRTPLNPILGWSKLLRSRNLDEKTTIRALETIERNAQLQSQLIEDLLDISRIIRGNLNLSFAPVNLAYTIQAAIETVALSAQAKSIEIKTVIQPNIGQILGNSERLQQVIWNLLSNAIKFTPAGGQVKIILETIDNLVSINNNNPQTAINNYAQIKVTDTGKGISPDFLPYVFDYFRQADATTTRTFGGLGLGLAIVRHLVELHGGTVQAESKGEGIGATFTVKLPLMPVQPAIDVKIELPSDSPNLSGVKILVVDDEVDSLDFCAFVLEQQGAIVTKVASATAALQALPEFQPDVLVSDIGMPEINGYMLMGQIRALPLEQGGGIRAIALTAYASETDQQQAIAAGFNYHLSKPVDPNELAKSIANLIASN